MQTVWATGPVAVHFSDLHVDFPIATLPATGSPTKGVDKNWHGSIADIRFYYIFDFILLVSPVVFPIQVDTHSFI
uniref:Uncharacterized protein n=1 Tax=Romanomermis culicivorax TaxID=13658 RepID=A0A915IBP6_ROMCU